jgi:tryptophan 7-halogenase
LYKGTGRIRVRSGELFTDLSWFYIFEGMGVRPAHYDPLLDVVPDSRLTDILQSLARTTGAIVKEAHYHDSLFTQGSSSTATA